MSSSDHGDEIDLLAFASSSRVDSKANDALREKVLRQTAGIVRGRRRWKRARIAIALAGCYLAGILTTTLLQRSDLRPSDAEPAPLVAEVPIVAPETNGKTPDQIADEAVAAEAAKLSRYELLRRAGDQYEHRGDLTSAIQSYKRALEAATPQERAISVNDDTWLLMALKNDQS